MTVEELLGKLDAKRLQLVVYRDDIDDGSPADRYARAVADGRIAQLEMDIAMLKGLTA